MRRPAVRACGLRPRTPVQVMLTFLLVGGFYVRDVPVWIGWIKYLSFVYWGNNLLIKIQFRGMPVLEGQPVQVGCGRGRGCGHGIMRRLHS